MTQPARPAPPFSCVCAREGRMYRVGIPYNARPCPECIKVGRLIRCASCEGRGYIIGYRKGWFGFIKAEKKKCYCSWGYGVNPDYVEPEPPKSPPPPPKKPDPAQAVTDQRGVPSSVGHAGSGNIADALARDWDKMKRRVPAFTDIVKLDTVDGLQLCPGCNQHAAKFCADFDKSRAAQCDSCGLRFLVTIRPSEPFGVVSEVKPDPDDPTKFVATVTMNVPRVESQFPRAIPVVERLPPRDPGQAETDCSGLTDRVFAFDEQYATWFESIYDYDDNTWSAIREIEDDHYELFHVTHWMSRPPDPME